MKMFYIITYRFDFITFNSYTEVCLSRHNTEDRYQGRNDGGVRAQEAVLTTSQLCGLSHTDFCKPRSASSAQCHLSLSVDNAFDVPAVLPGCWQGSLNTLQCNHYFVLLLPQQVEENDKLGRIVTKSVIG